MKNKIGKLFVFAILGFLASTISVSAKTYDVTDSSSFDAMMRDYIEDSTQSVYVIGSYVFTEDYTFTTQDMMLAALSIDLSEVSGEKIAPSDSYDKMTIFKLERQYDKSYNPTGEWKIADNFLGKDTLKENKLVDVTYVDYKKVQGKSSLSVNSEPTDDMKTDLQKYGYDVVLENQKNIEATPDPKDPTKIALTGTIYNLPEINNWAQDKKTGYYIAFEVIIPKEYEGKAQWWLEEDNKLTHDSRNYAVVGLSKEADSKTFEVWVDFDGNDEEYEPACYTFDYSGIEFVAQLSEATLSEKTENTQVKNVLSTALHISEEDFVHIDENNKITGDIHYNPDVTVDPTKDDKTNYYIPIIVEIDKDFVNTATITTKNNHGPETHKFSEIVDDQSGDKAVVAILFTVSKDDTDKTFTITIDLDGEGTAYAPTDYVYDYSEANFLEAPKAEVSATGLEANKETYANVMKPFGFEGNQETLKVDVAEDAVTLTGQLVNEKYDFNGTGKADVDGYYFQYVIEISGDAKDSSITIPTGPETTQEIKYANYDFKNANGVSGIVVLHKLNPEDEDRTFTVTVDLDGDGTADKTYTFNYEGLDLDNNSEVLVTVSENSISSEDKKVFEDWGFPEDAYSLTTIEKNVVKGALPYLENVTGFSGEEATGNFMIYTIELADVNKEGKAEVKLSCTTGANCKDGWKIVTPKANEDLSVMHHVKQNEDGSIKDIVAYVDLDGFENNPEETEVVAMGLEEKEPIYLPYEIRLTFDENIVVQQKSEGHDEVPEEMDQKAKEGLVSSFNWSDVAGQELTLNYENNTITVTGSVAKNTTVTGFGDKTSGYYIPFSLKFDKAYPDITIQMPLNKEKATYANFDTETEIGAILQIFPEGEKTATITVDLDGEGKVYEPYDITVDWSQVKFLSNGATVSEVTDETNPGLKDWMKNKQQIENFSFDDYDISREGNTIKITGKANAQKTKTGTLEWYVAYKFVFDKKYDKIEIKKADGTVITQANTGAWDGGTDGKEMTFVTKVTEEGNKTTTFTIDLDGEQGTTYEAVEYTVDWTGVTLLSNGVEFVKLPEEQKTGFETWMQNHKNFTTFKLDDFTVSQAGTKVTVTGTVKKNTTKDQEPNEQYWMAYLLKLDKEYKDIEITKPNGKVENYSSSAWDGNGHTQMTFTTNITDTIDSQSKEPITIKVDYDGTGELYEAVEYTIDWSGVTKASE